MCIRDSIRAVRRATHSNLVRGLPFIDSQLLSPRDERAPDGLGGHDDQPRQQVSSLTRLLETPRRVRSHEVELLEEIIFCPCLLRSNRMKPLCFQRRDSRL